MLKAKDQFRCTCGKTHTVPPTEIVFEENAAKNIETFFENATYVVGENTAKLVETPERRTIKLEAEGRVLATMENIEKVTSQVLTDHIVSIGSGSLTDIAKYAARLTSKSFSCFPTAPSVDGYTSSVAAILIKNEKTTVQAVVPKRVVVDMNVVSEAPFDLLRAGIGDIAAKVTARLDWMLSNVLTEEPICEFAWDELRNSLNDVLENSEKVLNRDRSVIFSLMKVLLVSGLNITVVGNSRPASSAEHMISHSLEMYHENRNEIPMFHGLSVAMGTYITLKAYRVIFEDLKLKEKYLTNEERFFILSEFFSEEKAGKFMRVYERKKLPMEVQLSRVRKALKHTYEQFSEKVENALKAVRVDELFARYEPEFIEKLILISNTIRERYTVLDLLDSLCLLKDFSHRVFGI
ncbi:hypothetical protein AS159_09010 [Thermotoga sp. Ku-13t]|uniref:iron-containing alcohol dehydrogenase n=1 Tax=Thermotoga sp. Ku-13t TaxID=1755813 RepID=UPI0013EB616F|nr:iron-containing alcohol dehydrogenase [Thermotoga sp. Ku-13t]KAF2957168.1 hypothetical protein AS159_09010 [Thermotoga sp. Ku-13t]